MPVRIEEPGGGTIAINELKDGQIVVITASDVKGQIGLTMCRCDDCFCQIGGGDTWWTDYKDANESVRCRVLPNGTTLTVEDNE